MPKYTYRLVRRDEETGVEDHIRLDSTILRILKVQEGEWRKPPEPTPPASPFKQKGKR